MSYIVEGEVVYKVIEYPDGGYTKEMRGVIVHVQLDGPDTGIIGEEMVYIARLVTWQGEIITNDTRSVLIEVWSEDEKLGQLDVAQGKEFELVFSAAGRYRIRASIEGTHTPTSKVVIING